MSATESSQTVPGFLDFSPGPDVEPLSEHTTVYFPGWSANGYVHKNVIHHLACLGHRVIAPKSYHHDSNYVTTAIERLGLNRVDGIGHSLGAMNLLELALKIPHRFRKLVLVNPIGLIGADTLSGLAGRFVFEIIKQDVRCSIWPPQWQAVIRATYHAIMAFTSDVRRTWQEVISIANARIEDLIKRAKESGLTISLIHGVGDYAFPITRMKPCIAEIPIDNLIEPFGGHNQVYLEPGKWATMIHEALTP